VMLLGMAVWLLSRAFTLSFSVLAYGIALILAGYVIGMQLPSVIGWPRLNRFIGSVTGLTGLLFAVLAFTSVANLIFPDSVANNGMAQADGFVVVHNKAELAAALKAAKHESKPAL